MKNKKTIELLRMGVNLDFEESVYYKKLFCLCNFNASELIWLHVFAFIVVQLTMAGIEYLFWGETFRNVFDSLLAFVLMTSLMKSLSRLSKFLIAHAISETPEKPKPTLKIVDVHNDPIVS